MRRSLALWIAALALAASAAHAAQARRALEQSSAVSGKVTSPDGGVVPGVTVSATSKQTGRTYTAVTDAEGRYTLTAPIGVYDVRVVGFPMTERKDVAFTIGATSQLDFSLGIVPVTPAAVARVTIKVTDRHGPLENVAVTLQVAGADDVDRRLTTDKHGECRAEDLQPAEWRIVAKLGGYKDVSRRIKLAGGDSKTAKLSMSKR